MVGAGHEKMKVQKTCDLFVLLPIDILENILQRLPLKEAARTSVLSKMWRELFLTRPVLLFDKQFFQENCENKPGSSYAYLSLIYKILLAHRGDIYGFVVYIPNLPCDWGMHIDQLLVKVCTEKNINELNLQNEWNSPYKLHSCIYFCSNLTILRLNNCVFQLPAETCSILPTLIQIYFENVVFASNSSGAVVFNLSLLQVLHIVRCTGFENFNFSSHKLHTMCIWEAHVNKPNFFEKFPNVKALTVRGLGDKLYELGSSTDLSKMHKTLTKLKYINLDDKFLKHFIPRGLLSFPYSIFISLFDICFDDSDQISRALWLIRNSPNLIKLRILKLIRPIGTSLESVLNLLEEPNCMGERLKLQVVELASIYGLKSELLFIKRILARSPHLKFMHVFSEANVLSEELKIANDLMRFRRASPEAEVIFRGKFSQFYGIP